jgi:hypothetical protein
MNKDKRNDKTKDTAVHRAPTFKQDRRVILKFVPKLRKVKKGGK